MAEKVVLAELDIDTGSVIEEQKKLGAEISELSEQLKTARKEGEQYTSENIKAAAELKNLKQGYSANQRILEGLAATEKGQIKNVQQARKVRNALNAEFEKSSVLYGENDERTKKIGESLKSLNEDINNSSLGISKFTDNIGNYNSKLGEAVQGAESMPGPLGGAIGSIKKLTLAAKAFILTPLGATMAAIAGVLAVLSKAFKSSEGRMNKMKVVGGAVSGVFKSLLKALQPVVDFIANTVVATFEKLGKVANKVVGFVSFGLKKLGFDKASESVSNFAKKTNEAADAGARLAKAENDLVKAQREARLTQLNYQKDAEKLRQIRDDEARSFEDRIAANKKLGDTLNKQLGEELKIAKLALSVVEQRIELEGDSSDNLDARAEALTEIADIEERITGQQSEQLVNVNTLIREQNALRQASIDLMKTEVDTAIEDLDSVMEAELASIDKLLEAKEGANNKELEDHISKGQAIIQATKDRAAMEEMAERTKYEAIAGMAGNLAGLLGEQTKLGKAAAIAQTVINTYLGAQAAFAATPGEIFIKTAAAIAATATGLRNLAKIKSVNTNIKKGSSASVSAPSASITLPKTAIAASDFSSSIITGSSVSKSNTEAATAEAIRSQRSVLVIEDFETVSESRAAVKENSEM